MGVTTTLTVDGVKSALSRCVMCDLIMRIFWILVIFTRASTESTDCVEQAAVERCLHPFLDVWEKIREHETDARDLLFPPKVRGVQVPFYERNAILELCSSYILSMDICLSEKTSSKCATISLVQFIDSHLKFFCGELGPAYLGKCHGMANLFQCVEDGMSNECGELASALFRKSIEEFGCLDDYFKATQEVELNLRPPNGSQRRQDPAKMSENALTMDEQGTDINESTIAMQNVSEPSASGIKERTREKSPPRFLSSTQSAAAALTTDISESERTIDREKISVPSAQPITKNARENLVRIDENMNETSTEAVFNTTEFAVTTTTHPPYCIPHRDHRTISFCHKNVMHFSTLGFPLERPNFVANNDCVVDFGPRKTTRLLSSFMISRASIIKFSAKIIKFLIHAQSFIVNVFSFNSCSHRKLSNLSVKSQFDSSVRFPLYDVSFDDLVAICNDLTAARKCMDGVDQLCPHPLLVFLKEQFSATCQLKEMLDFDIDYNCIQNKLIDRKDCIALLNTTVKINDDKCEGHEDFLSCMKADLEQVCGLESYNSVVTMLRGYGCNISDDIAAESSFAVENSISSAELISSIANHQKSSSGATTTTQLPPTTRSLFKFDHGKEERSSDQGEEEESNGEDFIEKLHVLQSVDDVTVQNSGELISFINRNAETAKKLGLLNTSEQSEIDESQSLNSASLLESPSHRNERMDSFEISDPLFNYTISSNCTVTMRNKARLCTVPLMRTWVALRAVWPRLAQITFPLYKYSRVDLLELCDSYADTLLCSNMNHLEPCVMDELVRFAQDHLGYVCSPKNIQRFMKHYDCIMEQEALGRGNCRQHILGEAIPGKDERKCHGVKEYRECLVPYLRKHCQPGAIDEFDATIRQLGCYTHQQHPNISGLVDL
ncbi:unnamed protein product [Angiostrongylus costaricensis]|uniref:DUF19 domain-containing protein n=1 Tax=Angiostrongylus costaricensis TaxID=334426 RepID=A0A158PKU6_ANGCS|nr:unnamed protein product [Angiostrongylus costaricensis]